MAIDSFCVALFPWLLDFSRLFGKRTCWEGFLSSVGQPSHLPVLGGYARPWPGSCWVWSSLHSQLGLQLSSQSSWLPAKACGKPGTDCCQEMVCFCCVSFPKQRKRVEQSRACANTVVSSPPKPPSVLLAHSRWAQMVALLVPDCEDEVEQKTHTS